jgi:hypothetical protein
MPGTIFTRFIVGITLILLTGTYGFASRLDGKTLTFNDFFSALQDDEKMAFSDHSKGRMGAYLSIHGFCLYDNISFQFNRTSDNVWDQRYVEGGERIKIKKCVDFSQCTFSEVYWLLFNNMEFEEALSFHHCSNIKFMFKDCVFKSSFLFTNLCQIDFIEFENCTFERGFALVENSTVSQHLKFTNCKFIYNESYLKNPRVNKSQYLIGALPACPPYFQFTENQQEYDLSFNGCYFAAVNDTAFANSLYINLVHSSFKSIEFNKCEVNVPVDIAFGDVANQFKFVDSKLTTLVADAINFNSSNAKLDWKIFAKQKIAIKNELGKFIKGNDIIKSQNKYDFETLISVYALFYSSYKQQGNRRSANACYVEWKDIETHYMARELKNRFTTDTWFSWFMNIFLKIFCDYGTNPLKSLGWSLAVMLAFTVIFMVYLWNFDTTEHKDVRFVFRNFGGYFTHNQSLLDIGEKMVPQKNKQDSATELRKYIDEHRTILPVYYRLFGMNISRPRLGFRSMFFYRWGHKILGTWSDAQRSKKYLVAVMVSTWMGLLLLKIMLIRVFDAFTMSLNSFSTLGYGDLPRSEAMRYLSIIEGFIGWFLLSIFIVALISQIIQ